MTTIERIQEVLREFGEPMKVSDIDALIPGVPYSHIRSELSRALRAGRVERVSHGTYRIPGPKTLSQVTDIEVSKSVRPVVPSGRVELKPQSPKGTVQILLETVANSEDPKKFAGVVREISELLATS